MQTHGPATDKTGFIYMLAGDTGASDTDPWATMKTAENLWVETGSHVMMIVEPPRRRWQEQVIKRPLMTLGQAASRRSPPALAPSTR